MEFDGLRWKMQSTGDVHDVDDGIMCYALMIEPSVSTVDALQTAFVYHQWGQAHGRSRDCERCDK